MKKAFTLIELIFVIVIMGLLAGVAIPRLSATRDDAKISQVAKNITIAAQEISSYVASKNMISPVFQNMSNAVTINGRKW